MKKNIIIFASFAILIFSLLLNCFQYKTITEQEKTIKDFKNYYNAAEDLLNTINDDISIEDTYMCGDVGANYYMAVSKLTDFNKFDGKCSKNNNYEKEK